MRAGIRSVSALLLGLGLLIGLTSQANAQTLALPAQNDQSYTVGLPIDTLSLPEATGG